MEDNEQQFTQLVRETKGTIFTVCYMFSKDEDEVNDLFQDTLVNLWRGFESFEGRSSAKTWVYRVALSTCISADRKKKRRGKAVPLQMNANLTAYFLCTYGVLYFFAVIDIALDYRINILNGKAFLQDNIKDIVSKLVVMKKHRFMQFIAGFLMGTFFILWLFYEFYKQQVASGEDFSVGLMFGTVGFIIGAILAIFVYLKMQHTNDAIIKQIQELNNE